MQLDAHKRSKIPRRGLPFALAALWACLGFQPCALAAAAGDSGCPHGATEAMPAGHAHGHDPAPAESDCDLADSSCCEAEAGATGPRTATLKASDGGEPDALPAPRELALAPRQAEPPERHEKPRRPPDRARPLHVLNCVYLD